MVWLVKPGNLRVCPHEALLSCHDFGAENVALGGWVPLDSHENRLGERGTVEGKSTKHTVFLHQEVEVFCFTHMANQAHVYIVFFSNVYQRFKKKFSERYGHSICMQTYRHIEKLRGAPKHPIFQS